MKLEHSIVISRPVDVVFALVGNPDRDTQWGSLIVESMQVTQGPVDRGTVFKQTASFLGARVSIAIEVTEYVTGRVVVYRVSDPVDVQHRRTFESVPEGTRLTFITEIDFQGKFYMPMSFLRQIGGRQMEADMDEIKTLLEMSTSSVE